MTNNTGSSEDLIVVDELPDEVDFIAVEPSGNCEETSGVVTCQFANVPGSGSNNTASVLIVVVPQEDGTIENTAQVFRQSDPFTPIAQTSEETDVDDNNGNNNNDNNLDNDECEQILDLVTGDQNNNQDNTAIGGSGGDGGNGGDDGSDGGNGGSGGNANIEADTEFGDTIIEQIQFCIIGSDNFSNNDDNSNDDDNNNDNDNNGDDDNEDVVDDTSTDDVEDGTVEAATTDPDELAPESTPRGDVLDEVATTGQLPETGGWPIVNAGVVGLALVGVGLLTLGLVLASRHRS